MSQREQCEIVVGEWSFRPQPPRVKNNGEEVELTSQAGAVLNALVEARGEVVATDELLTVLQLSGAPGKAALYQVIAKLRKIFYDTAQEARYIATVPKRGYRITAVIADQSPGNESLVVEPSVESNGSVVDGGDFLSGLSFIDSGRATARSGEGSTPVTEGDDAALRVGAVEPLAQEVEVGSAGAEGPAAEPAAGELELDCDEGIVAGDGVAIESTTTETGADTTADPAESRPSDGVANSAEEGLASLHSAPAVPPIRRSLWRRLYLGPMLLLVLAILATVVAYRWQPVSRQLPLRIFDSVALTPVTLAPGLDGDNEAVSLAGGLQLWLRQRLEHYPGIRVLAKESTGSQLAALTVVSSGKEPKAPLDPRLMIDSVLSSELRLEQGRWQLAVSLHSRDDGQLQWQLPLTLPADGASPLVPESLDQQLSLSFLQGTRPRLPATHCSREMLSLAGASATQAAEQWPATTEIHCAVTLLARQAALGESQSEPWQRRFADYRTGYYLKARQLMNARQWAAAEEQLMLALERSPAHGESLALVAQLLRLQGQYEQALGGINQALAQDPLNPEYRYWRARLLEAVGQPAEARHLYRQWLAERPESVVYDSPLDSLRFSHFGESTLIGWLDQPAEAGLTIDDRQLLAFARLSLGGEAVEPSIDALSVRAAVFSSRGDYAGAGQLIQEASGTEQLSLALLALAQQQPARALEIVRAVRPDWLAASLPAVTRHNYRFLPSLANMLFADGQVEQAKALLRQVLAYADKPLEKGRDGLAVVESYALLGQEQEALQRLAALVREGWLPDFRYRWWSLHDNPNLQLLQGGWQFTALNELVSQRQQMLRLRYPRYDGRRSGEGDAKTANRQ